MNRSGSYLKLIGNSISAITAAIEIYNKPNFNYRDECFIILLINAWELALKAFLSKNKKSIFYPKIKNQPYKTLSLQDAIKRCEPICPECIDLCSIKSNLDILQEYRNNIIHFYNNSEISVIIVKYL